MPDASPLNVIEAIQKHLDPELLKPSWRNIAEQKQTPFCGHCYHAAEALFYLLGGKEAGYKPCVIRHEGGTHWFLLGPAREVLDPTAAQFHSPVPYEKARGCGFLTKSPSKRAQVIIDKVQNGRGK